MMCRLVENLSRRMRFMPILMRKSAVVKSALLVFVFSFTSAKAQQDDLGTQLDKMMNDAVFFTGKYVSPAADATVYQAASSWIDTPKKKSLWDLSLGVHFNTF